MTINQITKILEAHGVPYIVKNGEIYADSMEAGTCLFENLENVTRWTKKDFYNYLGY